MLRLKRVWTNRFPIVDQVGNPVGFLLWESTARVNGELQTYEGWSLYYYPKPNDCERFVGRYATRRRALNVLEDLLGEV